MQGLLASLPWEEQTKVLDAARRRQFAKGEVVFHEGDPADAVHLVMSGHLAVTVATPDGNRAMLTVVGPGGHVGELALIGTGRGAGRRSATVAALDAVTTKMLSAHSFRQLRLQHPALQALLDELLATRINELSERLLEAMYLGTDRRLYRTLVRMADLFDAGADTPEIPLTQEQLADLVGGTRPTVNQVLQKLAGQGVIELRRGRVILTDLAALRRKSGMR